MFAVTDPKIPVSPLPEAPAHSPRRVWVTPELRRIEANEAQAPRPSAGHFKSKPRSDGLRLS